MLFSSISFLFYFFTAFLLLYFAVPFKFKNAVLLVFSLIFYAWGGVKYAILMVVAILIGYVFGLLIEKFRDDTSVYKRRISVAIILSILTLGIYKIFWQYTLVKKIRELKGDKSSCTKEMLCLVFVPFYSIYWWFTRGNELKKICSEKELYVSGSGLPYMLLALHGLGIIAMAIMQNDINSLPEEYQTDTGKGKRVSRTLMWLSVASILAFMLYFKYTNFFIENFNAITGMSIDLLKITLPVGISFYTFQTISYVIDVYRGVPAQKNLIDLAAYVSMFPQLIAGPIVRYVDVAAELKERTHSIDKAAEGIRRFIIGLGKKILIADRLSQLCDIIKYETDEKTVLLYWIYGISVALYIYFDFSGYSDMAIGLGKMFGFKFLENFNYPYISKSATEFWRRWHMSLGSWFRDYVYIPLGGNRVSKLRHVFNIFVVWFLTGFWHGAAWNFIFWGLFFGVLLLIEKFWIYKYLNNSKVIGHVYTLLAAVFSFVLFNATDFSEAITYIGGMFGAGGISLSSAESVYYLQSYAVIFILALVGATPIVKNVATKLSESPKTGKFINILEPIALVAILLVVTSYLVDGSFSPFLYFRF